MLCVETSCHNLARLIGPIATRERVCIFSTALDQLIGVSLCVTEYLRCGQTRPPEHLILVVNSNRGNVNTVTVNRAVQICVYSVLQHWLSEDDNLLVIWERGDRYTLRSTVWGKTDKTVKQMCDRDTEGSQSVFSDRTGLEVYIYHKNLIISLHWISGQKKYKDWSNLCSFVACVDKVYGE